MITIWKKFKYWLFTSTAVHRIDVLIAFGLIFVACLIGFNAVQNSADHALKIALEARQSKFIAGLKVERVCSETNQGQACRDLFTRLATNLSEGQRKTLVCLILYDSQDLDRFHKLNCVPPRPAPVKGVYPRP